MQKVENINEEIYNVLYGDDFLISDYTNIFTINEILNEDDFNYLNTIKNKINSNASMTLNLNNNKFNLYPLTEKYINIILYLQNCFIKFLSSIENNYKIPKNFLNINKVFYVNMSKLEQNNKIIEVAKFNYDFVLFYNLNNHDINFGRINLYDENLIIKSNTAIVISSNIKLNLNKINDSNLIIVLMSVLGGYKKYYFNKHPNQNIK